MKKIAIAAVVLVAASGSALAQSTTAKVPTGIDVKGATDYRLEGSQVIQIADTCDTAGLRRGLCERAGTKHGNREPSSDAAKGSAGLGN